MACLIMHSDIEPFVRVHLTSSPEIRSRMWSGILEGAEKLGIPYGIIAQEMDASAGVGGKCVGMITNTAFPRDLLQFPGLGYPVVNVGNRNPPLPGVAHVLSDDHAVGLLAARHLIECGYQSLVMIGFANARFSDERLAGFAEGARKAGYPSPRSLQIRDSFHNDATSPMQMVGAYWPYFEQELPDLVPDAGVFAATDKLGHLFLDMLMLYRRERLHTTGVIGVDNLELRRWIPGDRPQLSSVRPGCRAMGRAAICRLMAILRDPELAADADLVRIPPEGVTRRSSTGGYACAHPVAGRAGRWIWEQVLAGRPPSLNEVAAFMRMSSRSVERLFGLHHRRGVKDFVLSLQMDRACQLLRGTGLRIGEIATECGFNDQSVFGRVFRQREKMTPRAWRNRFAEMPRNSLEPIARA